MRSWLSGFYKKDLPVKDDEESQPTTTKPRNQNYPINIELGILNQKHKEGDINRSTEPRTENDTINNELGTPKQLHKESDINRRKIKESWWPGLFNKDLPVKDCEESQPTTKIKGSWWSGLFNKDPPVKDCEESQPTTKIKGSWWPGLFNKDPPEKDDEESQPTTKIKGSWLFGVNNKYHPIKGDEESQPTTTEPRIQNDTINTEPVTPKQIHKESDINRSIADGQEYLMKQKDLKILALEEQVKNLAAEKESLRLSQICCVKLSDGNPNITDLSDPNRADKLVGRFSELYDNQWTDSFQALCESACILEENAIRDLLQIVLNVYQICLEHTECQNKELVKAVQSFTGVKVGDKVEETIVQEYIHNLHIFRAKNYALKMADVKAEIGKSLQSSVDPEVYKICQDYITECTEVCWLMCVKSPPMYISADKTDTFQHHLYTGYTTSGKYVSYVVWPTLFQYKDGPIMQRGVAQGTNNKM